MSDEYTVFGTPLPELDEDDIVRKKVVEDLRVRDEKGRVRFHGAFTGGFSAGYFNSVGTKEGWAPSSFVSSRSNKADSSGFQQNPENFMDNEDFGEFGIAPKKIHTTTNFRDQENVRKRKHQPFDATIIPGEPPLKDLIKPVIESIGILLLKKMGWRQGQGIGPKVHKQEKEVKVYGCSLGPLVPQTGDDSVTVHMFAPDDTPHVPYVPKDDRHGIGYAGLSTTSVLGGPQSDLFSASTTKSWLSKDKKKLTISGQAFGVGALEDDDDDIYTRDDMSQYDFSELTGDAKKHSKKKSSPIETKSKYECSILEGFHLTSKPASKKKHYPAPELPPGYTPKRKAKPHVNAPKASPVEIAKQKLDPNIRSLLLGEKKFVKSTLDTNTKTVPDQRKSRFDVVPGQATNIPPPGLLVTSDFKPFATDENKQSRYEEFLRYNKDKEHLRSMQLMSMTEWEKQQELDEFEKASILYQPLSKALSSHFVSRSHLEMDLVPVLPEVKASQPSPDSHNKDAKCRRKIFDWYPSKLLCRRFNVPNPYPDSHYEGVPKPEKKPSLFHCLSLEMEKEHISQQIPEVSMPVPSISSSNELLKFEKRADEPGEVIIVESASSKIVEVSKENDKPPMDLFKDIFQTSSDESDNEDSTVIAKPSDVATNSSVVFKAEEKTEAAKNTNHGKKVAFGVFANVDLDAINKRVPANMNSIKSMDSNTPETKPAVCTIPKNTDEDDSVTNSSKANCYGPDPPPPLGANVVVSHSSKSSTHSKHKHKRHKQKSKKKKEKRKHSHRHKESSSSSSEEEITLERIYEKLKEIRNMETPKRKS